MMNKNEDIIFEDILNSITGIERAQPKKELFNDIENNLFNKNVQIIPMSRLRWVVAASFLLLAVNVSSLYKFSKNNSEEKSTNCDYDLTINFNYY